jgi:hypothetical protein
MIVDCLTLLSLHKCQPSFVLTIVGHVISILRLCSGQAEGRNLTLLIGGIEKISRCARNDALRLLEMKV